MMLMLLRRKKVFLMFAVCSMIVSQRLLGQESIGTVDGILKADSTGELLQSVNVALLRASDGVIITGTVTNQKGAFQLTNVPIGQYKMRYSLLGYEVFTSPLFNIDAQRRLFHAGTVHLKATAVSLGTVTVTSEKQVINTAIDRKVYNVQQDLLSSTGSVSDLLQNVPSVQVDVDGTVSLRGSTNVQVLINGKPSPLMAGGSADVLQQIPANSVEKIEVITNPSAKYKPEGTSGFINIVLKKDANLGFNGNIGANVGNDSRYNVNASGNYSAGGLNFFGTFSYRKDERSTYSNDDRRQLDSTLGRFTEYTQRGRAFARPYAYFVNVGMDASPGRDDKLGVSANFRRRGYTSNDTTSYLLTAANGVVSSDYDRLRTDYDQTPVSSVSAFYQHDFVKEDHTLRLDLTASHLFDEEDNRFINLFRVPSGLVTYDNRRIREYNNKQELTADYHSKLDEHSILEAGYDGTFSHVDFPYTGSSFDTTQQAFVNDSSMSNHFLYQERVHALYTTYQQSFGAFSLMGGMRLEYASLTMDLITKGMTVSTNYWKLYPTLHVSQKLNEVNELQLNYSLRVDRPGADDLNPFPEYQNPRSLRAGNPYLKPEYIHSIELGCSIQNDDVSIIPGIFYRNRYNGFTTLTKPLNDSTLLTTEENLSTDQSGGFELIVSGTMWKIFALNWSASSFYEQIDATNLGYTGTKSAFSWNSSLNCDIRVSKGTMFQINSNYRSSRLTPQGNVSPGVVLNLGLRQDLVDEQLSLVATVADVFASLKRTVDLNTNWLSEQSLFRRDSRVVFIGLTYHFGSQQRKDKEKALQYDDNG